MSHSESSSIPQQVSSDQEQEFNELRSELQETVNIVIKNNFAQFKTVTDNLVVLDNEFQIKSQIIFRAYDLLKNKQIPDKKFKIVSDGLVPNDAQAFKYDNIISQVVSDKGANWLLALCKEKRDRDYMFQTFLPALFGGYTTKSRCQARKKLFEIFKSQENVKDEYIIDLIFSFFFWEPGFIKNLHLFIKNSQFAWNNQTECVKTVLSAYEKALSFCSSYLHEILSIYIDDEPKYVEILKKMLFLSVDYLFPFDPIYARLKESPEGLRSILEIVDNLKTFLSGSEGENIINQNVKLALNGLSTAIFDSKVTGDIILSRYDFALIAKLNGKKLFEECLEEKNIFKSKCALIHVPTTKEFGPQIGIENYSESWKRIYMESRQNKTDFLKSIDGLYYIEEKPNWNMTHVFDNFYIRKRISTIENDTEMKNYKEELSRIISIIKNYKDFEQKRSVEAYDHLKSIQCDQEFILTYYKNALSNLSITARLFFCKYTGYKMRKEPERIVFDYRMSDQIGKIQDYANDYYLYQKEKFVKEKK